MKRILLPVLAILLLALGLGAGFLLRRRPGGGPPPDTDHPPFLVQPQGRGGSIAFQPSEIPIRSLRWSRPLPGRAVVAQLLTQSNRQQAMLFVDGQLRATLTLERPADIPGSVFNFAELADAAYLPGKFLLLLFRVPPSGEDPLLLAWDLQRGGIRWTYRGPGNRLALSPQGHRAFLFGPGAPVQILQLTGQDGRPLANPGSAKVELPAGSPGFGDLLPTGPMDFMAVDPTGLFVWRNGAWTQTPAPARSPLGFAPGGARLARAGDALWWQPEPGQLIQVGADGHVVASLPLAGLVTGPRAQDTALLRLLGADPRGALWFSPVAPDFTVPPAPETGVPDIPAPTAEPAPALSVPVAPSPSLQDTWAPYLKAGLGRVYRWQPGSPAMAVVEWSRIWAQLGAPAEIPCPEGDGGLAPEAEGCFMGGQEHRWWLPLAVLPLDQPR